MFGSPFNAPMEDALELCSNDYRRRMIDTDNTATIALLNHPLSSIFTAKERPSHVNHPSRLALCQVGWEKIEVICAVGFGSTNLQVRRPFRDNYKLPH